jgi:murein DD-endopeptidase MepM/ murein hydrolase activator NlpD
MCTAASAVHAAAAQSWVAPLDPVRVTRAFAPPPTPYAAGHRGVDLAGSPGEVVVAAEAGEVSYAANLAGRGVVVVVHGSLRTTYEPVTATVRLGAHVTRGQRIGTLQAGHPGCPVSACLHWGLRRGEQYLDPMTMVVRAPIILLPLTDQERGVTPVSSMKPASAASTASTAPSRTVWSLTALAGGGVILALRRR